MYFRDLICLFGFLGFKNSSAGIAGTSPSTTLYINCVHGVLYRNIKTLTDCQILQDGLNNLGQWETDWQMKFNVAKCHSMRVTRHLPSNQIHFNYSLHQQTLEQVESAKYLGITITDNLEWGQHVSEISSKATKTLGFLRRNLALAPQHTKEVAYQTLVRHQLEYAAPIWHPYNESAEDSSYM